MKGQQDSRGRGGVSGLPGRGAVLLSAFVFPGAGQALQKRWVYACVFGVGFLACLAAFCVRAGSIIISYYRLGFDSAAGPPPDSPVSGMLLYLLLSLLVYLGSLIDTYLAFRRICRARATLPNSGLQC